jgi:oligopeptide transport system permease protein
MNADAPRRPAPGQGHWVADPALTALKEVDALDTSRPPTSFWTDAWASLRRRPLFWAAGAIIVAVVVVAVFPGLFTREAPDYCVLARTLGEAEPGHILGFNKQGCDVFARLVYGARASVTVGVLSMLVTAVIGAVVGGLAGYYGGWLDTVLSRVTDIFFALPAILAAIVIMQVFRGRATALTVVAVIATFGWTQVARITRGAVMAVKASDFATASKALGLSRFRILVRHCMPNALAPIIVTATTQLGTFIVLEATLSFLGLGLPTSVMSWGNDIAQAQSLIRIHAQLLFWPAGALALTVLGFIMMGDAVRDALDPKTAKR